MKKEDLKASLGKIKPREELINSTLVKMSDLREREERKTWLYSPSFARGMKLAGAFCAFALVFVVGFAVLNGNKTPVAEPPVSRTLAEIDTSGSDASNTNVSLFTIEDDAPNGWIIVSGDVESFGFSEPDEEEKASGAIHKGTIDFAADNVAERSADLNVDLAKSSTDISADIIFYDEDSLNAFVALTSGKILLRVTPMENGSWRVLDFAEYSE